MSWFQVGPWRRNAPKQPRKAFIPPLAPQGSPHQAPAAVGKPHLHLRAQILAQLLHPHPRWCSGRDRQVPKTAQQPGQGPSRSSGAAPCPDGSAAAACRDAQRQGDVPRPSLVFPSTQKHGKRRGGETYFGRLPCFSSPRGFNQGPVKPMLFIPALQPLFCSFLNNTNVGLHRLLWDTFFKFILFFFP